MVTAGLIRIWGMVINACFPLPLLNLKEVNGGLGLLKCVKDRLQQICLLLQDLSRYLKVHSAGTHMTGFYDKIFKEPTSLSTFFYLSPGSFILPQL